MVDGLSGQGTALALTVGVAIDTGGKVLKVGLQLALRIQCGSCMVQIGYSCAMKGFILQSHISFLPSLISSI